MIPKILAPNLSRLPGIAHGFATRQSGVSEGIYASLNCGLGSADAAENIRRNRARFAASLGADPQALITPYQVHGTEVVTVTSERDPLSRPRADALVTKEKGMAIAIGIADCGPLLFADAAAGVIGAAHAGWQGALAGVVETTVSAMEALGAARSNIHAALGPTISRRSYEVGSEFHARFLAVDLGNEVFFQASPRANHFCFDLPAYITGRLDRLGLASQIDLELCTYEDEERFFSFRRASHRGEADYGRMLAGIMLLA